MKINNIKNKMANVKSKIALASATALTNLAIASPVLAADAGQVKDKLNNAATIVKSVLTGLIVVVGICVSLFIILKHMPDADDPREKSEVYKAVARVAGLVALGAAIIWILPWVYDMFK